MTCRFGANGPRLTGNDCRRLRVGTSGSNTKTPPAGREERERRTVTTDLLRTRRLGAILTVFGVLALAGCQGAGGSPSASASVAPTTSASAAPSVTVSASASTAASVEPSESQGPFACALPVTAPGTATRAQITDLRVGTHSGYDRIVFEFAAGIPEYRIEEAAPPFTQDPSGLPMNVAGSTFWKIVLNGGTILSPDGGVTYSGSRDFSPGFPRLVQFVTGGDFEAVSTWYVGLSDVSCIRVQALSSPSRLVIDIQH